MLLALVIEPAQAIGVMLPLLMLMDVTGLRKYWNAWSWPHARNLMVGAIPGAVLGAIFFRSVSQDGLRLIVGCIAVGFVLFQIARARGLVDPGRSYAAPVWGVIWGCVAGFTSFVSHAGGPPAAMYLISSGLSKTRFQGSTVLVFWWINVLKFPPYLMLGMFTAESALANVLLAPVAVAGVLIGVQAHHVVSEKLFFRFTYALLTVTGLRLIYVALG